MQWSAAKNAGFSDADTTWLPVHDDFEQVNVEAESADPSSPLSWYRKLAELRAQRSELVAGTYEELLADSEQVYAYRRQGDESAAVVLANLSGEPARYDEGLVCGMALLVGTHGDTEPGVLRPLEAVIFGS
jgi:alpha-glucosidase